MSDTLIDKLAESFKRFPGIGPRQARRFVHYLLRASPSTVNQIADQLRELKKSVNQCADCRRYYPKNNHPSTVCQICADANRDHDLVMLVEKDIDLENIERSGTYHGYYFVLGGLTPILDKNPAATVRADELLAFLKRRQFTEIIIALSATLEGDHTIEFIKEFLHSQLPPPPSPLKITTLGRGLSTGAELEYSDPDTLKNALKHRE